jgi:hypothetical protein
MPACISDSLTVVCCSHCAMSLEFLDICTQSSEGSNSNSNTESLELISPPKLARKDLSSQRVQTAPAHTRSRSQRAKPQMKVLRLPTARQRVHCRAMVSLLKAKKRLRRDRTNALYPLTGVKNDSSTPAEFTANSLCQLRVWKTGQVTPVCKRFASAPRPKLFCASSKC